MQVIDRTALSGKPLGSGLATLATKTIDGHRATEILGLVGEVGRLHVNILGTLQMPLGIFIGSAHIDKADAITFNKTGEIFYTNIFPMASDYGIGRWRHRLTSRATTQSEQSGSDKTKEFFH